jgi:hypothetical protein
MSRLYDVKSPSRYRKYLENLDKHKQLPPISPVGQSWGDLNDTESVHRHEIFMSSFQVLVNENKQSAIHILMLSASFGIETIREPFFSMYYVASPEQSIWLEQLGKESRLGAGSFQSIVEDLQTRGLVQKSQKDSQDIPDVVCHSIHPDIRAWLRMRQEYFREDYSFEAVSLLFAYIQASKNVPIPLPIQRQILTHLDFCLSEAELKKRVVSKSTCKVAICFANFYRKCSRFTDSKRLLEELKLHADAGDTENSLAVLDTHPELGDTLRDNYEYSKAEKEYLAVGKFAETLDNERNCRYLIGLGTCSGGRFQWREARTFGRQALILTEDIRF